MIEKKNLLVAVGDFSNADEARRNSWHFSKFRSLLADNLRSKNSIVPAPNEEYPRVRSYRGTGVSVNLEWAHHYKKEKIVRFNLNTDFVEAGVDIFMESEGCPGANTMKVSFTLNVPEALIENTTKEAFDAWIKEYSVQVASERKANALETIRKLAKANNLTVSVK